MLGRSGKAGGSEVEAEVANGVVMAEAGTDSTGAAKPGLQSARKSCKCLRDHVVVPAAPARSQGFGGDTVLDIVILSLLASHVL